MLKRPMLTVAIFSVIAAILAFYLRPIVLSLAVFAIILSAVFIILKKKVHTVIFCVLLLLMLTVILNTYNKIDMFNSMNGNNTQASFTVISKTEYYGENISKVTARITDGSLPKGCKIELISKDNRNFYVGEKLTARVTVSAVSMQYKKYRYGEGIYGSAYLNKVISADGTSTFLKLTSDVSEYITDILYKSFSSDIAATLNAILSGDQSGFTEEFRDNITATGVNHVMVVSGMHLAILLGGLFSIIDRVFYNRLLRFILSAVSVLFLVAVCGFSISIIRAGLTFIVCAGAGLFRRENDSLNSLGTAVSIILLSSPFAIFSIAFQLSVLSTFGVIVLAPFYSGSAVRVFKIKCKFFRWLIKTIFITLSATIMVMPVLIINFGYFSVIAVITNILTTYFVTYALIFSALGLIFALLPFWDIVSNISFIIAGLCAKYINAVINILSEVPFALLFIKNETIQYVLVVLSVLLIVASLLFMRSYKMKRILSLELEE